jgi:hypothetical protein
VTRCEAGLFGNPRQHAGADFLGVVESEDEVGPAVSWSVRCDPDCRLMLQPIRSSAASTRLALAAGQLLTRLRT